MSQLNELLEQGKFAEAVVFCENELTTNPSSDNQYNLALSNYNLGFQQQGEERKKALETSKSIFEKGVTFEKFFPIKSKGKDLLEKILVKNSIEI